MPKLKLAVGPVARRRVEVLGLRSCCLSHSHNLTSPSRRRRGDSILPRPAAPRRAASATCYRPADAQEEHPGSGRGRSQSNELCMYSLQMQLTRYYQWMEKAVTYYNVNVTNHRRGCDLGRNNICRRLDVAVENIEQGRSEVLNLSVSGGGEAEAERRARRNKRDAGAACALDFSVLTLAQRVGLGHRLSISAALSPSSEDGGEEASKEARI